MKLTVMFQLEIGMEYAAGSGRQCVCSPGGKIHRRVLWCESGLVLHTRRSRRL
jgi:hypothetical protein